MTYHVHCYHGYDALPERYRELLHHTEQRGLFQCREWFEFLLSAYYDDETGPLLYCVEDSATQRPLLLTPWRATREDAAVLGANALTSIGHMENFAECALAFDPAAAGNEATILRALFEQLRATPGAGRPDVLRLWPFAVGGDAGEWVREALQGAGYVVQRYANSYNWYEDTAGIGYGDYLQRRSSNQRYNSRRKRRSLEQAGVLEFEMITGAKDPEQFARAYRDYILVSVESWKSPGTTVSANLLRMQKLAAATGSLRLGVLRLDGEAIAAQFWVVGGGVANMMRNSYREQWARLSPGVVLTDLIIEYLLDVDRVGCLDFGYGGDEYKEKWLSQSRHYCGFMAFEPATRRGLLFGFKHIWGQAVKRAVLWLAGPFLGPPAEDPKPR